MIESYLQEIVMNRNNIIKSNEHIEKILFTVFFFNDIVNKTIRNN